ncbi:hypothetical protein C8A03DRAFT_45878 [Achaetomium macrosporum]|uniref:GED domain-containing protein n=1 Tax=Achaetomium macrosporum TaxID=79813 RepID=A0AAN7H5J7_9PEZI|nr:hypothetical protein C8A03DRAFT_45878 [Achaetomium macrosporum]
MGQLDGEPVALQSKDHRDLLDVIDSLRSQGFGRYVDLPLSSALEAISGMSFPAKDNLCTRFATELILRRTPTTGLDVSIIRGSERTGKRKVRVKKPLLFKCTEKAKAVMGLNGNSKAFSTDILRVELSGPSQPHLTLVDLPGLFLAGNKDQTEEDAAIVEALVSKSDFALQQVTRHARAQDPEGTRTLGLITKPDTMDEGSDNERFYIELAQNKDVQFRLGWHVLRNRTYAERDTSTAARDAAETAFFFLRLGVAALRVRLSHVLCDQILGQLPSVLDDVTKGLNDCKNTLARLGTARSTIVEQRRYLLKVSAEFSDLTKAAIDGIYTHAFFSGPKTRRLRAVIQNTLADFAEETRLRGHARTIVDKEVSPKDSGPRDLVPEDSETEDFEAEYPEPEDYEDEDCDNVPPSISRSEYIKDVKRLMQETRGRELSGTYNPLIDMVLGLQERVIAAAAETIDSILRYVADGETAEALLDRVLNPTMEDIKKQLSGKVDEILEPNMSGHPITYNHYLTDNVQKVQSQRKSNELGSKKYKINTQKLLDAVMSEVEPDMDTYSCTMAIDMMEAYYKVALKTVVDSISTLAIERCLVQKLPSILSSEIVFDLSDEEVKHITAESSESAAERAQATEKLAVLENAMVDLKRLKMHGGQIVNGSNGV